jgi:hypothetical protein
MGRLDCGLNQRRIPRARKHKSAQTPALVAVHGTCLTTEGVSFFFGLYPGWLREGLTPEHLIERTRTLVRRRATRRIPADSLIRTGGDLHLVNPCCNPSRFFLRGGELGIL